MRESNLKIEKIQKSSRAAAILANVAKTVCIVAAAILLVVGFLTIGFKDEMDREIAAAVESGAISLDKMMSSMEGGLAGSLLENGSFADTMAGYLLATGAMMICFAIIMHFIGKVFKDIQMSYSPFRPEIIKSFKVAFVLITLMCLRSSLLIGAVIGFSLWCVIRIFEYGCELQKQSDETL